MGPRLDPFSAPGRGGKAVAVFSDAAWRQDQVQDDPQKKQARQACQKKDREKPYAHLMNPPC